MKFINCAEALPGRVEHRFLVSEKILIRAVDTKSVIEPSYFRLYAGLNENWSLDKIEWLDETPVQLFTADQLEEAFANGYAAGAAGEIVLFSNYVKRKYNIDIQNN